MTGGRGQGAVVDDWLARLLSGDGLFMLALAGVLVLLVWWVLRAPPDP